MADRTIRIGKVSSVDYGSGMIKVTYPDLDNSVTDDLPYLTFNDEYKMPKVGASVLVVHLSTDPRWESWPERTGIAATGHRSAAKAYTERPGAGNR